MTDDELKVALKDVISGIRDIIANCGTRPRNYTYADIGEEIDALNAIREKVR